MPLIFSYFVFGVVIFSAIAVQAEVQGPDKASQAKMLSEMVSSIRREVKGSEQEQAAAYAKIRVRLLACAITYMTLSNKPGVGAVEKEGFKLGGDLYFQGAVILGNANKERFQSELAIAKAEVSRPPASQREIFLFLRACQDFSNPQGVQSAVMDVLLK